jgi:DNA-binding sugar fermentation-stimulating protein
MINDNQNFHFAIVFLVNRGDCSNFKPNWQKDPIYSKRLTEALKSGVDIYALGVSWDDKTCKFNGQLNVDLKPW